MKKSTRRWLWGVLAACLLVGAAGAGVGDYLFFAPQIFPSAMKFLYIDRTDTPESIYKKVYALGNARTLWGFRLLAKAYRYGSCVHTGCYAIKPQDSAYELFQRLYRGHQQPVDLTIGSVRTVGKLLQSMGEQLMIDSAEIADRLNDTACLRRLGYTTETLPAFFIPNTYQVYWNMDADRLFSRMEQEHERFWNASRKSKAQAIGLTEIEVCTLASIVEEETNNAAEMPVVAGLYINRLRIGMPLQADPTVKFALQDFGFRRISKTLLSTPSPYNTYLHAGLPPGPIRIASPQGIDAVLNYARHNYLYMCAKEDFSGTHNFTSSYARHLQNARRYQKALDRRKIFE